MAEQHPSDGQLKSLLKSQLYDLAVDLRGQQVAAGPTGVFWGVGGLLAIGGLSAVVVSAGLKLAGLRAGGTFFTGLSLMAGAAVCILQGARMLPLGPEQSEAGPLPGTPHARA